MVQELNSGRERVVQTARFMYPALMYAVMFYVIRNKRKGRNFTYTAPARQQCSTFCYSATREDDTTFVFSHFGLFLSDAASNSHK